MPSTRASSIGGCRSSQGSPTLLVRRRATEYFEAVPRQKFSITGCISGGCQRGSREAGELRLEEKWGERGHTAGPSSQIITSLSRETISTNKVDNCKMAHQCCNKRTSSLSSQGPSCESPPDNGQACARVNDKQGAGQSA